MSGFDRKPPTWQVSAGLSSGVEMNGLAGESPTPCWTVAGRVCESVMRCAAGEVRA